MYITTFKAYVIHNSLSISGDISVIVYSPLEWFSKTQGSGALDSIVILDRDTWQMHVINSCTMDD